MIILGLDLETTGTDRTKDRIIEGAAVIWDTVRNQPLRTLNSLIYDPAIKEIDPVNTSKTGIDLEMLQKYGVTHETYLKRVNPMFEDVGIVVAHNGESFDIPFWESELQRAGLYLAGPRNYLLVDTMLDVPYPERMEGRSLSALATEHEFLNPFPHRALFDVMTMLKILSNYPIEVVLRRSCSKSVVVEALVSFEKKDLAKENGFFWNQFDNKKWTRTFLEDEVVEKTSRFPFKTSIFRTCPPRNSQELLGQVLSRQGVGG